MKFSFSTLGCPDWSIEQIVAAAKDLKYDGVEIRGVKRVLDLSKAPEFSSDRIASTRKLFADAGIPLVCMDSSAGFCWPEQAKRQEAFDEAVRHVELAEKMGAPFVRVFGGAIPAGDTCEKWARTLADNLIQLGRFAKKRNVTVIVETHNSWNTSTDLMPVIRMVGMDNVRVLWDMQHSFVAGETIAESVEGFGEHIAHVHVKDHSAEHKEVLLGRGILPIDEVFVELKRIGYGGYISLEWEKTWRPEIEDPEIAFPQAIEYLRRLDAET